MKDDVIVEERQWRRGVEIVSHVNHTQVARVRASLNLVIEPLRTAQAGWPRLVETDGPPTRRRWRIVRGRRSSRGSTVITTGQEGTP
ncbi:MAG: hypothetical protein ACRENB_00750 [Gemmatimonadales bacterium]